MAESFHYPVKHKKTSPDCPTPHFWRLSQSLSLQRPGCRMGEGHRRSGNVISQLQGYDHLSKSTIWKRGSGIEDWNIGICLLKHSNPVPYWKTSQSISGSMKNNSHYYSSFLRKDVVRDEESWILCKEWGWWASQHFKPFIFRPWYKATSIGM